MADFNTLPAPDLLQRSTTLFTGIRDTPEIAEALLPFQAEAGERTAATAAATTALTRLEALFARHRKLARAHHDRGSDGYRALGLAGRLPDGDAEFVATTDAFYRAADASPALYDGIRGFGKAAIVEGLARVDAARTAEAEQARESGEAQRATSLRQDAEARLRALADEVADVTEVALGDAPQFREVVGLFERGA